VIDVELARLPAGTVAMHDARRKRKWAVELEPFEIGVFAVTEELYAEHADAPSRHPRRPATDMSWYAAIRFCNALSEWEGYDHAYAFDGVDVAAIRHHEEWIAIEGVKVAVEKPGHLAGIRGADEERQRHSLHCRSRPGRILTAAAKKNRGKSEVFAAADRAAVATRLRRLDARTAAPPSGGAPGHLAGAVVAEVRLLRPASRIRERHAENGALPLADFLLAIVTNEYGLPGQRASSFD